MIICVKLLEFCINIKLIIHNKIFWKMEKFSLIAKSLENEKIREVEKGKVISEDAELVESFNEYFRNIVKKSMNH